METGARARGLAGWARERALGGGVPGRWAAAASVPTAYQRMTAHSRRVPQPRDPSLRMPAKMMRGDARCASLIGSCQLLEIELTRSQQTRKLFMIGNFSVLLACSRKFANQEIGVPRNARCADDDSRITIHQSQIPIHWARISCHSSLLHCPPLPSLLK